MTEQKNGMQYDTRRIETFGRKIGPLVREYIDHNGNKGSVMGIPTAGRLFAVELYKNLLAPNSDQPFIDVTYWELDRTDIQGSLKRNSAQVRGRHLIVVDDDIHTKATYEEIQNELDRLKGYYDIPSINWAVEFDGPGIAKWACNRMNNGKSRG